MPRTRSRRGRRPRGQYGVAALGVLREQAPLAGVRDAQVVPGGVVLLAVDPAEYLDGRGVDVTADLDLQDVERGTVIRREQVVEDLTAFGLRVLIAATETASTAAPSRTAVVLVVMGDLRLPVDRRNRQGNRASRKRS